jgi:hypothetical protein
MRVLNEWGMSWNARYSENWFYHYEPSDLYPIVSLDLGSKVKSGASRRGG